MLRVTNLFAGYGKTDVLHGVSFEVKAGQCVSLIGANGAGKSTTLKCITGLLPSRSGSIEFEGVSLERLPGHQIVRHGITMCPEGRQVFGGMSVGLRAHTFMNTSLDEKTVELINTVISNLNACKPCTSGHVTKSRDLGASDDQLLEAIQCASTMAAGCSFLKAAEA